MATFHKHRTWFLDAGLWKGEKLKSEKQLVLLVLLSIDLSWLFIIANWFQSWCALWWLMNVLASFFLTLISLISNWIPSCGDYRASFTLSWQGQIDSKPIPAIIDKYDQQLISWKILWKKSEAGNSTANWFARCYQRAGQVCAIIKVNLVRGRNTAAQGSAW